MDMNFSEGEATPNGPNEVEYNPKPLTKPTGLLEDWRRFKYLRKQLERTDLSDDQRKLLLKKTLLSKEYLYNNYVVDACKVAYNFITSTVPKKSLLTMKDGFHVVLSRMWKDMETFDPEYAPESEWAKLQDDKPQNIFMKWFNSATVNGQERSRLRGAVRDELRRLMHFPRSISGELKKFNGGMAALRQKLGKEPTLEEYLDEYGWDLRKEVSNPLLFSQVFSQSNAKPGENLEDDTRFEKDRRREQSLPDTSCNKMGMNLSAREKRIMDLIPNNDHKLPVIAYLFWEWNIPRIAKALGISNTLAAKRKNAGYKSLMECFPNLAAGKAFLEREVDHDHSERIEADRKEAEKKSNLSVEGTTEHFMNRKTTFDFE